VLIPTIAHVYEKKPDNIKNIYSNSYNVLFPFALVVFCGIVAFSPYISIILIGHYESTFVFSAIVLSFAWFVNTINMPAYSIYLGIGNLRWITINHIMVGILNMGLGLLIGTNYGGKGVVIARAFALGLGSLPILVSYHYKYNISLSNLLPRSSITLILALFTCTFLSLILYYKFQEILNFNLLASLSLLLYLLIMCYPIWKHPVTKQMKGYFSLGILKKTGEKVGV
jgi:O-antigen/teichoic acid export membrane protein